LPGGTEEYHKTLQSMVHGVNWSPSGYEAEMLLTQEQWWLGACVVP
jgi:hypothetical protein